VGVVGVAAMSLRRHRQSHAVLPNPHAQVPPLCRLLLPHDHVAEILTTT
jgi:hypothetical protein